MWTLDRQGKRERTPRNLQERRNMGSLGIDVAKAKLDCVLLDQERGKQRDKSVPNTTAGVLALVKWLGERGVPNDQLTVVMEPTGVYHEHAAQALHEAGLKVHLVNPA